MCLRLNTSAGATSASITVQRAALFAGVAMSKAHVDRPSEYVERRDDD